MAERHKLQADGILGDGSSFYPYGQKRQEMYKLAHGTLSRAEAPILYHVDNPHEFLFVAGMDGTGNDADADPAHKTNVARIIDQIHQEPGQLADHIVGGYIAGPGTQKNWLSRTADGIDGYTSEERAETMYKKFIDFARRAKRQDSQARISIAEVGFSRGADEIPLLTQLIQERGIQDPSGAKYTYTSDHLVKDVQYTKPPLVPPGQVAQAVALMDPVGTGNEVRNDDRRLAPTVISGLQLTSTDERRILFKSDHIIDPGISPDGRFIGLYVPGAHSDVGGSYHRNGLSNRAGNLVIDYLNSLSDQPFLAKQPEPDDPRLNVVHRSEEGMFIYRIMPKIDRLSPDGYRELLVPEREIGKVPDPFNNEPRDESLSQRYQWQPIQDGPIPATPGVKADPQAHALSQQVDQMLAAARAGDWSGFMQGNERFAEMNEGQALRADARAVADAQTQLTPPRMPDTPALSTQGWQR